MQILSDYGIPAHIIDTLAPAFFTGEAEDAGTRKALAEVLAIHLPTPVQPWYRALVPDFFVWLEQ